MNRWQTRQLKSAGSVLQPQDRQYDIFGRGDQHRSNKAIGYVGEDPVRSCEEPSQVSLVGQGFLLDLVPRLIKERNRNFK